MHPIERLRFVARAEGADDQLLAVEATAALMTFADQPAALVAGCRRILARQPCCGPLWWACARLLTAEDLWATAQETLSMLESDPTEAALRYALGEPDRGEHDTDGPDHADHPARDSDVGHAENAALTPARVVRARALGAGMALLDEPIAWRTAGGPSGPCWLVATVGTRLSEPMWEALVRAVARSGAPFGGPVVTDLSSFTHVVGPFGPVPVAAVDEPDCPVAPELFTLDG